MDLVELVEGRKFLGQEFLVWLWFESEVHEGTLQLSDASQCELWLESQLTLEREREQASLKGLAPSANAEAHEALRQGKLPIRGKIRILRNELEYAFVFNTSDISMSSVRIPAQLKQEKEEQFYERMYLLEELEALVEGLFADFLILRMSNAWDDSILPTLQSWVRDEPINVDDYVKRKAEALRAHKGA